jgi:thiosulfate/3-mercaptopyruvate sulfurtransferase
MQPVRLQPIVSRTWLDEQRRQLGDRLVLADVRWYLDGRSGRAAFDDGHALGAIWVDLDHDLAAPGAPTDGRHPLPAPDELARRLGALGIGDDDVVVAYDDAGGMTAGRLVWMLRTIGQPAALLDGGIGAFDPAELTTEAAAARPATTRTPVDWPADRLAAADELVGGTALVADARSFARFTGEDGAVDLRAGHIPGAISVPWQGNLDPATGRFLPPDALRERFTIAGLAGRDVVASCGSGVSACHLLLAMEHAGLPEGRLFGPSWSGWSADLDRPVATGPA